MPKSSGDSVANGAYKILLVDDEPNVLAALRRLLRHDGYRVLLAESAEVALAVLEAV